MGQARVLCAGSFALLLLAGIGCSGGDGGGELREVNFAEVLGTWTFQIQSNASCSGPGPSGALVLQVHQSATDVSLAWSALGQRHEHLEQWGAEWWLRHGVAAAVCPRDCLDHPRRRGARRRRRATDASRGDPERHGHGGVGILWNADRSGAGPELRAHLFDQRVRLPSDRASRLRGTSGQRRQSNLISVELADTSVPDC